MRMFDGLPSAFAEIRQAGVNLARIPRTPSPDLRAAVARVLAGPAADFDLQVDAGTFETRFAAALPPPALAADLAADMAAIARQFAAATGACGLRARFERIEGPGCKLFHVDYVECRLITTYAGAGTEYLADADVDRARLGRGSNRGIKRRGAAIARLAAYEIGLFKGEGWPGNRGGGIVHRSPPATRDDPRLVFVLDALCAH